MRCGKLEILLCGLAALLASCRGLAGEPDEATHTERRRRLAKNLSRQIHDRSVLQAVGRVPRHRFIPQSLQDEAYDDCPLPIGRGQTISQPYIVAYMSQALKLSGTEKVLEIGTGSGYQAAVLSCLAKQVFTVEIVPELSRRAQQVTRELGFDNIEFLVGDGFNGWPEKAPFDGILVTAAPLIVPPPLVEQLKEGGRLVIPLGPSGGEQVLKTFITREGRLVGVDSLPVSFVPMTGRAQQ